MTKKILAFTIGVIMGVAAIAQTQDKSDLPATMKSPASFYFQRQLSHRKIFHGVWIIQPVMAKGLPARLDTKG